MAQPSVIHATFIVEKSYPKPPDRVFAAFSDPAKLRRWYAERPTHDVELFETDFRSGGSETLQIRFRPGTPFPGAVIVNRGVYQDIVANKRIVLASCMAFGENRFSASLVTFEFLESATGTDLIFTHQGAFFEGADGPQLREKGWHDLLARLDQEMAH